MKIIKDKIFNEKKVALKSTIAFLRATKKLLAPDVALEISREAAANYMIMVYEEVFSGTKAGTQERFDAFRANYEKHPEKSPYCKILISTPELLKVRFDRCPYAEILLSMDLFEYAEGSCISDRIMTEKLMPGVKFFRETSIVEGQESCIMSWEYKGAE